ncbi:hypothetical protein CR105_20570 [Massilia eurypsychrophila]|uniref:Uncharacterized protein n=1 Tax=Massilia eurypsychrophila TaxID=1485217 RepID=A0A2G8TB32_9BURK|nr:hypothetical protein CR105_20570 [Massilia eurypsychrophila]
MKIILSTVLIIVQHDSIELTLITVQYRFIGYRPSQMRQMTLKRRSCTAMCLALCQIHNIALAAFGAMTGIHAGFLMDAST